MCIRDSPYTIPALKDLLDSLPASVIKLTLHTFNIPGVDETDIQFEEIQSLLGAGWGSGSSAMSSIGMISSGGVDVGLSLARSRRMA